MTAASAWGQWVAPPRFSRPELDTDEGGLWSLMDREETRLRRSPFMLRDAELRRYVEDIACRLAGAHCPDLRVYLVRTPFFNANMAPNGMMQIWSGLMLRVENEAQLAAVIAHEIAHYVERHSVERLRAIKDRTAFAQFLGAFGLVGAIGQIAVLASAFAYTRDQERAADRISVALMHRAGYDCAEAATVWGNLLLELRARESDTPESRSPLFATHPNIDERRQTLLELARTMPGGEKRESAWRERLRPHLLDWVGEEIRRGQHEESLALFTRLIAGAPTQAAFPYARAEVLRLRGRGNDFDAALADYHDAIRIGSEPVETHRGAGLIYRARQQSVEARACFERYLDLAPGAPDALLIRNYMETPAT